MSGRRQRAEKAGRRGEALAAFMLRLKGYRILEQRYRSGLGEIDLIAQKGNVLIFIEVKHRNDFDAAMASVGPYQAGRIMDAADLYMSKNLRSGRAGLGRQIKIPEMRFDIIVTGAGLFPRHVKDAFRDPYGG